MWPPPREAWLPVAGVVLLYAGHFFYGALISKAHIGAAIPSRRPSKSLQ